MRVVGDASVRSRRCGFAGWRWRIPGIGGPPKRIETQLSLGTSIAVTFRTSLTMSRVVGWLGAVARRGDRGASGSESRQAPHGCQRGFGQLRARVEEVHDDRAGVARRFSVRILSKMASDGSFSFLNSLLYSRPYLRKRKWLR